ncbi:MAG: DNA mismatch endonuclease Vsr [Candidatus Omnitrophica bacterium]|nr:DNA mismatch endonuclease Vsr [Candidatus Omnitrophota bacterium]
MVERTDPLSPEQRERTMRAVKSEDTGPELRVRKLIHSMGYRYSLHRKDLPGKPDIVLRSRKKIVFIHGCFWHGHHCPAGSKKPKTNADYWERKIERNVQRDRRSQSALRRGGWSVAVVWECQTRNLEKLERRLRTFLEK